MCFYLFDFTITLKVERSIKGGIQILKQTFRYVLLQLTFRRFQKKEKSKNKEVFFYQPIYFIKVLSKLVESFFLFIVILSIRIFDLSRQQFTIFLKDRNKRSRNFAISITNWECQRNESPDNIEQCRFHSMVDNAQLSLLFSVKARLSFP